MKYLVVLFAFVLCLMSCEQYQGDNVTYKVELMFKPRHNTNLFWSINADYGSATQEVLCLAGEPLVTGGWYHYTQYITVDKNLVDRVYFKVNQTVPLGQNGFNVFDYVISEGPDQMLQMPIDSGHCNTSVVDHTIYIN